MPNDTATTTAQIQPEHSPGLKALFSYPLMSAITERRTRRISRGTSLVSDGLSYTSANAPAPLSPVEEAVLIVSTGLTGAVAHDGPLQIPGGGIELGTPFLNVLGRAASSPDNAQATTFFMINDDGVWLLKRLAEPEAFALLSQLPPNRNDWSNADWIAAANAVKVRLFDQRLEFPREFPYYLGWNKQISNRPGTTVFMPVVDCTRACINILLILLSEPDGQRPLFIDDWQKFKPADLVEAAAWLGSGLVSGASGLLLSNLVGLDAATLTFLVISSLAATLIGRLRSITVTFIAGIVIGLVNALVTPIVSISQYRDMTPFVLATIALLVLSGRRGSALAGRAG
jgi:hypothetical protein